MYRQEESPIIVQRMDDDSHLSQTANLETSGVLSYGTRGPFMEESDDPELYLLHRSTTQCAILQSANRERAQLPKCFGSSFTIKAHKTSRLSQRRNSYKLLQMGKQIRPSRCRKWNIRATLTKFFQIDRDIEISSIRMVRQVLYYA